MEVARRAVNEFSDGVCLLELAPITNPVLLPNMLARTLGVPERPDKSPLTGLVEALGRRQLLFVLDNCEHLAGACTDLVSAVLQRCPRIHVLATSRTVLRIAGETILPVAPLSLPEASPKPTLESMLRSEAVQLFVERAQTVAPKLRLTLDDETIGTVATLCRNLDGLPLAIELAASWMRVLSPEALASGLETNLSLLENRVHDAPARHRTLRAALDWSYRLLAG